MASNASEDEELAPDAHGLYDATWQQPEWKAMVERLVDDGFVTWKEAAATLLGELNPPQVGTQIASSDAGTFGFKANHRAAFPDESLMSHVLEWFYSESGRCVHVVDGATCGTRLDLQADHVNGRENFRENPHAADTLDNLTLRCRRHNVAKRKSHVNNANRTLLPAQQALMWILIEIQPYTKYDFGRLCRIYGMTMASVRFDEAWAMAVWREREGRYQIAAVAGEYDLIVWPDGAVTRRFASGEPSPHGTQILASEVQGGDVFCFLASPDGVKANLRYYECDVARIPFVYPLDSRPPTDIAIWPTAKGGVPMPPRGLQLHSWVLRRPDEEVHLSALGVERQTPTPKTVNGLKVTGLGRRATVADLSLVIAADAS
ncbi:hypothetical protein [Nocardioides ganghwensis]|uniref:Uncharacterized protein n=1 Tax=Nocardioides ganghwensis TaxID=252230 RepID=A0A4Q2S8M4_9ACTN|nr:hypothetical protein [Nocardioides ganghwensis]MBD3947600.1 hypothetical protein [Nocardioides ganghwensis]RYB99384.1 hypothetical protein EUA07_16280 [Nocardioides ganghwensis]